MKPINLKYFLFITLITSIWINASEVFRYFVFVRPATQEFFNHQPGIAEMDWNIFLIWGFWDTLLSASLVYFTWLTYMVFASKRKCILIASTSVWATVFVIFWIATANMGLSNWSILYITLPLSWLEMVIGSWIAIKLMNFYKVNVNGQRVTKELEYQL